MRPKVLVKTTKSLFDLQMDLAEKQAGKSKKGISFVIITGNRIEFVNISTTKDQKFQYHFDPSTLSSEERKTKLTEQNSIPTLLEDKIQIRNF